MVALRLLAGVLAVAHARRETLELHEASSDAGAKCSEGDLTKFMQRFQVGGACKEFDRLAYSNPQSPKTIALYLYPDEDLPEIFHGAFALCENFDLAQELCSRVLEQSEQYTVLVARVSNVEEATDVVKNLPEEVRIKHLVLGGQGEKEGLFWGDPEDHFTSALSPGSKASKEFLDAVYPHLLTGGDDQSTVFLDSCMTMGLDCKSKDLLQYVAHGLSGAKVFTSALSWNNKLVSLKGDGSDFKSKITSWLTKTDLMKGAQMGTGELKDWHMVSNAYCKDMKKKKGVKELTACRAACEEGDCAAFVWYKTVLSSRVCYLSSKCKEGAKKQDSLVFFKP